MIQSFVYVNPPSIKCHKYVPFGYGCVCEPQKPPLQTDPIPYGRSYPLLAVGSFNNDLAFVNGGISASMKSVQPQRISLTKPFIVSACTIFIAIWGRPRSL